MRLKRQVICTPAIIPADGNIYRHPNSKQEKQKEKRSYTPKQFQNTFNKLCWVSRPGNNFIWLWFCLLGSQLHPLTHHLLSWKMCAFWVNYPSSCLLFIELCGSDISLSVNTSMRSLQSSSVSADVTSLSTLWVSCAHGKLSLHSSEAGPQVFSRQSPLYFGFSWDGWEVMPLSH